ncbi:MAG: YqgE/AlgH family protein [Nitriliruptoraceae bacterium]
MTSHTGKLLVALPALADEPFRRTVVLLLDHDADGALGVVLNRPTDALLDGPLAAWAPLAVPPQRVFGGGPVEPTAVVAIGRSPDGAVGDWEPIIERVRLVALDADVDEVADEVTQMRVFAGYAGWSAGQLEDEIAAGAWVVVDADPVDVFTVEPDRLWRHVLQRQPGTLKFLAVFPDDPTRN